MNITDITGTRSYIKIHFGNKIIKVEGELLINGFAADKRTMKGWEPPYDKEPLTDREKQEIIEAVEKKTKGTHMVITFE